MIDLEDIKDLDLKLTQETDPKTLSLLDNMSGLLTRITHSLEKPFKLPDIFSVKGSVDITKLPPVEIKNQQDLSRYFASLEKRIVELGANFKSLKLELPKIDFPKIDIPRMEPAKLDPKMVSVLEKLSSKIESIKSQETSFPKSITVDNFPATYIPTPATNININPLQGVIKTTATTVGTTLTSLPGYGQLFNRRSLQ